MKSKKIISCLLALSVWLSCFAFAYVSYAKTNAIQLDILYEDTIDGVDDMIGYVYTPEVSGTYAFISYSTGKSSAYLCVRETLPDGSKRINNLAYAPAKDPDYMSHYRTFVSNGVTYTHSSTAFYLEYHLEAGTKYYFYAGWDNSASTGKMRVRLTNVSYDSQVIDKIEANCSTALTWYTDGEWRTDSNGERYYFYNVSKLLQNMTVTITYRDGSKSSVTGKDMIDGYKINYDAYGQNDVHWYTESDPKYTANILRVSVLDVSCDCNIKINMGSLYFVSGMVTDYVTGQPVKNATVSISNSVLDTTDENGKFYFHSAAGMYRLTIKAENAISRTINLTIVSSVDNDHTNEPIGLVVGDYNKDGIINLKDYQFILKEFTDTRQFELNKFSKQVNFKSSKYPALSL